MVAWNLCRGGRVCRYSNLQKIIPLSISLSLSLSLSLSRIFQYLMLYFTCKLNFVYSGIWTPSDINNIWVDHSLLSLPLFSHIYTGVQILRTDKTHDIFSWNPQQDSGCRRKKPRHRTTDQWFAGNIDSNWWQILDRTVMKKSGRFMYVGFETVAVMSVTHCFKALTSAIRKYRERERERERLENQIYAFRFAWFFVKFWKKK